MTYYLKESEIKQLKQLREFRDLYEVWKNILIGDSFWRVETADGRPDSVSGPYLVKSLDFWWNKNHPKPFFVVNYSVSGIAFGYDIFLNDLQNHPAKAIFRTNEAAQSFLQTAQKLYNENLDWQVYHLWCRGLGDSRIPLSAGA